MPIYKGTNFEKKTENGKQIWYWTDKVGANVVKIANGDMRYKSVIP